MTSLRRLASDFLANLCGGVLCGALFLSLIPDLKETRQESRRALAYDIAVELANPDANLPARQAGPLDVLDPWGTPYVLRILDGGRIRVSSAGEDQVWSEDETGDDIHSDQPDSPTSEQHARRTRQWWTAVLLTGTVWVFLRITYRRFQSRHWPPSPETTVKSV